MPKVLITTVPFGERNHLPIERLEANGVEYKINPLGRRLTEEELAEMICDCDVLIAGTEPITNKVMECAKRLKLIARVGIGLDNVDLIAASRHRILVSYTPDAPSPAVAELTIGLILSLLRSVHVVNTKMHQGVWHRHFGKCLSDVTVGIVGAGRIGSKVIEKLSSLAVKKILVNDINPNFLDNLGCECEPASKDQIYQQADVISLHVPLTAETNSMIGREQLLSMNREALLVNTARGGIINEQDLFDVMTDGHLAGAAIDVFSKEPYAGPLMNLDNVLLTSHMGSMSVECRNLMEAEATEEAVRFLKGEPLENLVPAEEYKIQEVDFK